MKLDARPCYQVSNIYLTHVAQDCNSLHICKEYPP